MRLKGKVVQWNADKAFGFITPNGGGDNIFIHKTALSNRSRTPQINDVITFSVAKDKTGRYCVSEATFSGEKLKKNSAKKANKFSIYLAIIFLITIIAVYFFGLFPKYLLLGYLGMIVITFFAYALDKSAAKRGGWRTQESTLHLFSLFGGWAGAAIAQQLLRHKSSKKAFQNVFWITLTINIGALIWLYSSSGAKYLALLS
ncbi:DUF1294 domain-containing protein [Colwellia sp. MB02u-14]|jgi:uncharacterized membrane protein YsdA (DUF1294 family)/cold shock CspA family protein|uniref:DUF1294 domain-containing protein n=1 Tax=Colwellia sp. MB02u-14 TaxID=2759815 RepID=UPI0015F6D081|nr:DUF1294 domain-containing protein [Colwellia sp. MB02u-14]MBA6303504.1 cold shock and DUF1294 domain-containing protein [Colwellia sp. MB02u-14]